MSARIAEFQHWQDALRFRDYKGYASHVVCGGVNMPYAVRKRSREELDAEIDAARAAEERESDRRYMDSVDGASNGACNWEES